MKSFTTLDTIAVVVYLVAIAAFGSSFYRRRATAQEYFLGGRQMWWLPAGISIVAADLSAITIMGTPAWAYDHNLELWTMAFGYVLMAPVALAVFVQFYARLDLYTAYEYLERRFDVRVRLVTSALFQILRGFHVAIVVYAPALVIQFVTGLPEWQSILLVGLFTTFYTTLGGIKAVIWTDVIQFCMVSLGIGLMLVTAIGQIPGGLAEAYRVASEAGRFHMLNLSTDPSQLTSVWACLLGGFVLSLAPLATDQAVLQRLFTTKSVKDCRRSVLTQAVILMPLTLTLFLVGTALFVFYKLHPERLTGLTKLDAIVPFFAVRELPSGLSGLIIASILAASMAVMSAGINSLTTATTVDFYQRVFRPRETPQHYARVGRIGTLAWGGAMTVVALFAKHLGALALAYNKVSSVVSGPLLGIFLLATLTRRATTAGTLFGAAAGMATVFCVIAWTNWSFFYQGPIGVLVTYGAGYAASLLTPRPGEERVRGLTVWSLPAERA